MKTWAYMLAHSAIRSGEVPIIESDRRLLSLIGVDLQCAQQDARRRCSHQVPPRSTSPRR